MKVTLWENRLSGTWWLIDVDTNAALTFHASEASAREYAQQQGWEVLNFWQLPLSSLARRALAGVAGKQNETITPGPGSGPVPIGHAGTDSIRRAGKPVRSDLTMQTYYVLWTFSSNHSHLMALEAPSPEAARTLATGYLADTAFQQYASVYVFDKPPALIRYNGEDIDYATYLQKVAGQ